MEASALNIILILAPLLIVVIFTLLLVSWFLNHESRRRRQEFLLQHSRELLRYRLQAYERFALLLERITPEALVLREQEQNMTVFQLQNRLLKTIRAEFNHNLAMQIYLPPKNMDLIKQAREEVVRLINTISSEIPPNVPAIELGRRIIEQAGGVTHQKLKRAFEALAGDLDELGVGK